MGPTLARRDQRGHNPPPCSGPKHEYGGSKVDGCGDGTQPLVTRHGRLLTRLVSLGDPFSHGVSNSGTAK